MTATTTHGLKRLKSIIKPQGPIPVSRSTWWAGVKSGRFPAPNYCLGNRLPTWRDEDIRNLIESMVPRAGLASKGGDRS